MVGVGVRAPDATVFVRPEEPARLSELMAGRPTVLLFFPLAFSGLCTKELCAVADDFSGWERVGANVIALSVDSPYTNVKYAESVGASFPVVSDFNREATRAYDVERTDVEGLLSVSERAAFVIDSGGTIRYAWVGEHPGVFPPLEDVRAAVARLG